MVAAGPSTPDPLPRPSTIGSVTTAPGPYPRPEADFYSQIGGHETFETLVRRFYDGVREDELLAPMYPEDDMDGAVWRLTAFLEQYWGGPGTYSQLRGHPRLRMRHAPFRVTPTARDRWLAHMRTALLSLGLAPLHEATLWDYLERAAHAMVNAAEDGDRPSPLAPPRGGSLL